VQLVSLVKEEVTLKYTEEQISNIVVACKNDSALLYTTGYLLLQVWAKAT
jgi:hypothetical protein